MRKSKTTRSIERMPIQPPSLSSIMGYCVFPIVLYNIRPLRCWNAFMMKIIFIMMD